MHLFPSQWFQVKLNPDSRLLTMDLKRYPNVPRKESWCNHTFFSQHLFWNNYFLIFQQSFCAKTPRILCWCFAAPVPGPCDPKALLLFCSISCRTGMLTRAVTNHCGDPWMWHCGTSFLQDTTKVTLWLLPQALSQMIVAPLPIRQNLPRDNPNCLFNLMAWTNHSFQLEKTRLDFLESKLLRDASLHGGTTGKPVFAWQVTTHRCNSSHWVENGSSPVYGWLLTICCHLLC